MKWLECVLVGTIGSEGGLICCWVFWGCAETTSSSGGGAAFFLDATLVVDLAVTDLATQVD